MPVRLLVLCLLLLFGIAAARPANLVTARAAGDLEIGMTIAEARDMLADYELTATSDGDGVPLLVIKKGDRTLCYLYAGYERKGKIEFIELIDPEFVTAEGVHPGMTVVEAEALLGPLQSIQMSEIEAREYATFTRSPEGIQIRLLGRDSDAGVYTEGNRTSAQATPGAYVYSLSINK